MVGVKEAYSLQGIFSSVCLQSWQELAMSVPLETLTFGWKKLEAAPMQTRSQRL